MLTKKAKAEYALFEVPLPVSPERRQIQVDINRYLTLLNEAMGPGMPEAIGEVIHELAAHSDQIERGVVVWVRLIEVLVQNAQRTGATGELKKADVMAAAHYLIEENPFAIPRVPQYLQAVILEVAVDWLVEIVYTETERYHLWTNVSPEPPSLMRTIRMAIKRLKDWTRPFWDFLANILARAYLALRYSEPLTPELKDAVDAVERNGFLIDKRDFFRGGVKTVLFIGQHGEQVIALSHLVFEAVRDAERFRSLSGPEKKQYAMDVVLTVLNDLGIPVDNGIIGAVVRSFASGAIESAVDIFSRRDPQLFTPHLDVADGLPAGDFRKGA